MECRAVTGTVKAVVTTTVQLQFECSLPVPSLSLTRQHGGEQSGLVTLTFDLLTLKVVSESRVT